MGLAAAQASGLSNIVPFIRPPVPLPAPVALGGVGALGVAGLIGALAVGGVALGALLALGALSTLGNKTPMPNPNTGGSEKFGAPPFNGGQSAGVNYLVTLDALDGGNVFQSPTIIVEGKILGAAKELNQLSWALGVYSDSPRYSGNTPIGFVAFILSPVIEESRYSARIAGIVREDRQTDTGGDPSGASEGVKPSGYVGDGGDRLEDRLKRKLAPPIAPLGTAPPTPAKNFNESSSGNQLGSSPRSPESLSPSPTSPTLPTVTPIKPSNPSRTQPPLKQPDPFKKDDNKAPIPPSKPVIPDSNQDLGQKLTGLAAIIALISTNTQPDAQRLNAKNGSCDALNSPSCTDNLKKDIKDPLLDKINQNAGAISGVGALLSTINNFLTGSIFPKLEAIQSFSEKVARAARLDKVYNLLTFLTVIHNASMLSNSLATTLMDTLSLGLATVGVKDENESPIDIQSVINSTVENKVKSIIGVENYTVLSDRWKKAVRVYQAAANITYQVRSLWDSAKSLAELTGANVGKIGNALRRDGVVAENAYTAMADNPLMVNNAMTKLQNLEEAASHLNSITSEAYGVTETVTQIKKDQDDFKKLAKESLPIPSVPNDAAKAKDDAAKLVSVSPNIANTDLVKP